MSAGTPEPNEPTSPVSPTVTPAVEHEAIPAEAPVASASPAEAPVASASPAEVPAASAPSAEVPAASVPSAEVPAASVPSAEADPPETAPVPNAALAPPQRAYATDKPVLPEQPKETSQYVVTVNNLTGTAVKIERLDEESGARSELSEEEYAQIAAASSMAASPFGDGGSGVLSAYYQGYMDYLNAATAR